MAATGAEATDELKKSQVAEQARRTRQTPRRHILQRGGVLKVVNARHIVQEKQNK
jgi:hypothetical protein